MNKSYASYIEAKLINHAFAARRESANLFCMGIAFENSVRTLYNGKKYINPAAMSLMLDCNMFDLMSALEKHKRAIGDFLFDGNYGNTNYAVSAADKVYLQGWINFLSLPCFADSPEAAKMVKLLKEEKRKAV